MGNVHNPLVIESGKVRQLESGEILKADSFQVGTVTGPFLKKDVDGISSIRNANDNEYDTFRVAAPQGIDDAVTLGYFEQNSSYLIVTGQADTSISLGNNTNTRGLYVVSTPGSGAIIGDILYDTGKNTGTRLIISAKGGRTIISPSVLSGGSISFVANGIYFWNSTTVSWELGTGNVINIINAILASINELSQQTFFDEFPVESPNGVLVTFTLPYNHAIRSGSKPSVKLNGLAYRPENILISVSRKQITIINSDLVPTASDSITISYDREIA